MDKNTRILLIIGVVLAALVSVIAVLPDRNKDAILGGVGFNYESVHYPSAIGSASSPVTLKGTFSGAGAASSSQIAIDGFPNVTIAGTYTPKSHGSFMYLQVQRSIDNGTTFVPYMTITPETSDVLVNYNGTSSIAGSPFVIPGNASGTTASGTAITWSFDLTLLADYIKIFAKEVTTSTFGTLNAQIMAGTN